MEDDCPPLFFIEEAKDLCKIFFLDKVLIRSSLSIFINTYYIYQI